MKWPVSNEKAWIHEALRLLQFLSTFLIFLSQKLAFCLLYSFIVFYLLVPRPTTATIRRRAFFIVVPPLGMDCPCKRVGRTSPNPPANRSLMVGHGERLNGAIGS